MNFKTFTIRLCFRYSLIFFSTFLWICCAKKSKNEISIIWENDQAVSLHVPKALLQNPDLAQLTVRLVQTQNQVPILGQLQDSENGTLFTPLIPFTRGQNYEVLYGNSTIGNVSIPELTQGEANLTLMEIYPTQDTLPENQLKIFLKFSKPMREGKSLTYLTLLNGSNDTLKGIFLDLQPELWNENQTMLTLWLDPGRIKRDLIPNLEMGAPLKDNESYRLFISDQWQGKLGGTLKQSYSKEFIITSRDSLSPNPTSWILDIPKMGTTNAFTIDFLETLDYSLLQEVFRVIDIESQEVLGKWVIGFEEKSIQFTPESAWKKGKYSIEIESRLEDLAGNNLNRLFETDLINPSKTSPPSDFKRLEFEIKD